MFIEVEIDWNALEGSGHEEDVRKVCINTAAIETMYSHKVAGRNYTVIATLNGDGMWYSTETYETLKEKIMNVRDDFHLTGPL